MYFHNRSDAGKQLAKGLFHFGERSDTIVLALSQGGVPVAYQIAEALHLPLDLMIVLENSIQSSQAYPALRAIQAPYVPEQHLRNEEQFATIPPPPRLTGKTVLLVDDGCATAVRMLTAIQTVAKQEAVHIVVVVPVASHSAIEMFYQTADEVVCLYMLDQYCSIDSFYQNFSTVPETNLNRLPEIAIQRSALQ